MVSVNGLNCTFYAFDVTPSDTLNLVDDPANTRKYTSCAVMCKTAGNVVAVTANGQTITFASVPAYTIIGGTIPIMFRQVRATGTTAQVVALVPKR